MGQDFREEFLSLIEKECGRKFAEEVKKARFFEDLIDFLRKKNIELGKKAARQIKNVWPFLKVADMYLKLPDPSEAWRYLEKWKRGYKKDRIFKKYLSRGKLRASLVCGPIWQRKG